MELLANHLVLAEGESDKACKLHVLKFFEKTSLVRYDNIVIEDRILSGTDPEFENELANRMAQDCNLQHHAVVTENPVVGRQVPALRYAHEFEPEQIAVERSGALGIGDGESVVVAFDNGHGSALVIGVGTLYTCTARPVSCAWRAAAQIATASSISAVIGGDVRVCTISLTIRRICAAPKGKSQSLIGGEWIAPRGP